MPGDKEISAVIKTLKRESRKFRQPAVTEIAERDDDPYKVLVSCLLSLRTRDTITERIAPELFAAADTPAKMAKLPLARIRKIIRPINYYKTKAKRIKEISRVLVKKYGGKVPSDIDELLKLKGVGRKTANIVVVYGFSKEGLPIDVHCHRVPNRLGWIKTKTPEQTEKALRELLPKPYWHDFNDLFVQFGQNVCTPRNPKCGVCPVSRWCDYYHNIYLKQRKS
ncbi:MAG: endonuclease III [Candidatus Aenigmarchaeota archaeon]|nr:endonuclease III [Candidatus Aenigmarchaeota archaeon]